MIVYRQFVRQIDRKLSEQQVKHLPEAPPQKPEIANKPVRQKAYFKPTEHFGKPTEHYEQLWRS